MAESSAAGVEARVMRYRLQPLRLGSSLVAVAMPLTIWARRAPDVTSISAMAIAQALMLVAFFFAIKRIGWRTVRVERSRIWFGSTGEHVRREHVHDWARVERLVRLYGTDAVYTLKVHAGSEEAMHDLLAPLLGKPRTLVRRGSRRARMIALCVSIVGLALVGGAFALNSLPLIFIGVPAGILGLATFGALSQRMLQPQD